MNFTHYVNVSRLHEQRYINRQRKSESLNPLAGKCPEDNRKKATSRDKFRTMCLLVIARSSWKQPSGIG